MLHLYSYGGKIEHFNLLLLPIFALFCGKKQLRLPVTTVGEWVRQGDFCNFWIFAKCKFLNFTVYCPKGKGWVGVREKPYRNKTLIDLIFFFVSPMPCIFTSSSLNFSLSHFDRSQVTLLAVSYFLQNSLTVHCLVILL